MEGTAVARLTAVIFTLIFMAVAIVGGQAQDISAPAPAPFSNGIAIDQGIAYVLMFAALLLTYFLH